MDPAIGRGHTAGELILERHWSSAEQVPARTVRNREAAIVGA